MNTINDEIIRFNKISKGSSLKRMNGGKYTLGYTIPHINEIIKVILSVTIPDKIVLFGSYARGEQNENSDIDLMILKKGLRNERKLSVMIDRALLDDDVIDVAIDLFSVNSVKYNEHKFDIGFVYKTIYEEGLIIYE